MTDNLSVAGSTIATDEVTIGSTTVHAQRVKLGFGDDGTYTGDVSRSVPLPVDAAIRSDVIQNSGSQLTPKFATVILELDGNIVAAVSGKKIRVLAMTISCDTANEDVNANDGQGGTTLWGCKNIPLGVTVVPFCPVGWFETTAGNALYADITSPGTYTLITVVYVEV